MRRLLFLLPLLGLTLASGGVVTTDYLWSDTTVYYLGSLVEVTAQPVSPEQDYALLIGSNYETNYQVWMNVTTDAYTNSLRFQVTFDIMINNTEDYLELTLYENDTQLDTLSFSYGETNFAPSINFIVPYFLMGVVFVTVATIVLKKFWS
jgi:hypothetical protein